MARVKPFRRIEIDREICDKVLRKQKLERYRGSFTSYVESILDLFGDNLLSIKTGGPAIAAGAELKSKSKEELLKNAS